jgi:hypothetical protein
MKIYVVTSGEYSDYHVVAIFSNKDVAEKFNKDMLIEENKIEEWELDNVPEFPVGLYPYHVEMKYDGHVVNINRQSMEYFQEYDYVSDYGYKEKINTMTAKILAKDEKHAIKIANEKRAQMIANNEWLPDEIAIEKAKKEKKLYR